MIPADLHAQDMLTALGQQTVGFSELSLLDERGEPDKTYMLPALRTIGLTNKGKLVGASMDRGITGMRPDNSKAVQGVAPRWVGNVCSSSHACRRAGD